MIVTEFIVLCVHTQLLNAFYFSVVDSIPLIHLEDRECVLL